MARARRLVSSMCLLTVVASCTLVESYNAETSGLCESGLKACGDRCVGHDDPVTGCGNPDCAPCLLPNATATCGGGACKVASCAAGFDDCDGVAANGCEANLDNDVLNCASCGRGCARSHASGVCVRGQCAIGTCDPGYADCNTSFPDGCEAKLDNDPGACGRCGNACAAGRTCSQGQCLEASRVVSGPASRHACAILSDNSLRCWGNDDYGQIGDNATCSGAGSCVTASAVQVEGNLVDVAAVATGEKHTCAVTRSGVVSCWGSNASGQLGLGSDTSTRPIPQQLTAFSGSSRVTSLTAGANHTCALTNDGAVWCWGDNSSGQVGNGSPSATVTTPTPVVGGDAGVSIVSLAAGAAHTCAARADGQVLCWGDDSKGQLGDSGAAPDSCGSGASAAPCARAPVTMATINDGVNVACGGDFTCVIRHNGFTEWCTGDGALGQLGNGGTSGSAVPVQLANPGGLGQLSSPQAGGSHACSLLATNATLWCWGSNARDQLFAASPTDEPTPITVGAVGGVVQVALGLDFSCAMITGALVRCVGDNSVGQLGLGQPDANPHPAPAPVSGLP
jgi:alpha-tubulin suppressor-like RCC1 family protein